MSPNLEPTGETKRSIRIVKARAILPDRREELLKTLDHFETQAGRLIKMAHDIRAEVLSLTVEK